MALVTKISTVAKERQRVHGHTECSASVVTEGGERYLQLDTYGSSDRQYTGKVSQSIQLSKEAAADLKKLIEQTFLEPS